MWLASDGSESACEEVKVLNQRVQVLATLTGEVKRFCQCSAGHSVDL